MTKACSECGSELPPERVEKLCGSCWRAEKLSVGSGNIPGGSRRMTGGTPGKAPTLPGGQETAVAGECRPGGGFMPYIGPGGSPLSRKQFADNRGGYNQQLKTLRNDPEVFKSKTT